MDKSGSSSLMGFKSTEWLRDAGLFDSLALFWSHDEFGGGFFSVLDI